MLESIFAEYVLLPIWYLFFSSKKRKEWKEKRKERKTKRLAKKEAKKAKN